MQSQTNPYAGLLTLTAVVLTIIAIVRGSRKWHTAMYVIGCMIAGLAVGVGVGLAFHSPPAAGTLGALLMQMAGIASAIERIRFYGKTKRIAP